MTKALQEVNSQIMDNLKDCNKKLEFKYDDDSYSFNVLDGKGTGKGYKYIYRYNGEDEKVPLDGADPDETFSAEISAASFDGNDYAFLTSNLIDIPLLHSLGISYLVIHNNAAILDYGQEFNNIKVCFIHKSEAVKEVVNNILGLGTQVIRFDFDEICPGYSKEDPLVTITEKIQESGELDGSDTINKFIYSNYKRYTDKAAIKSTEVSDTPDSNATSNKINIGAENSTTETGAETNVVAAEQKNIKSLPIEKLINNKKYQSRVSEDGSAIEELAAAYKAGEDIPPLEVVDTGDDTYIIADGHHRYAGAKMAEMDHIKCHITIGTKLDAFKLSLGANESNKALKRTRDDKRNAVMTAFNSDELKELSHRKIADICKVSSSLVDNIAKELLKNNTKEENSAHMGSQEYETQEADLEKSNDSAHIGSHKRKSKKSGAKKTNNSAHMGSTKSTKAKPITEKISNEHILISIKFKSKPPSQELMQVLLSDLKNDIDAYKYDYEYEYKEDV